MRVRTLMLAMLALLVTACGKSEPPTPVETKPAVEAVAKPTKPLTPCEQTCKAGCVHAGDKEAGKWSTAPELEQKAADVDIKFCEAQCSMDKCLVQDAMPPK